MSACCIATWAVDGTNSSAIPGCIISEGVLKGCVEIGEKLLGLRRMERQLSKEKKENGTTAISQHKDVGLSFRL